MQHQHKLVVKLLKLFNRELMEILTQNRTLETFTCNMSR